MNIYKNMYIKLYSRCISFFLSNITDIIDNLNTIAYCIFYSIKLYLQRLEKSNIGQFY